MATFIEQQPQLIPPEDNSKDIRPKTTLLSFVLNRKNQLTLFVWVFALVVPVLIYYFLFHTQITYDGVPRTCAVNSTFRVPCGVVNSSRSACIDSNCCFDDSTESCFHYLPSFYAYNLDDNNRYFPAFKRTPIGTTSTPNLRLEVVETPPNSIRISLEEVEDNLNGYIPPSIQNFTVNVCNRTYLGVDVLGHNGNLLMTTCLGPLISSENYLEWTFYLGDQLFGFDRLHFSGNQTVRKVFYHNGTDHNTLPVFMGYQNGSFHSLSIEYGGPMELIILPSRLIIVRAIGHQYISVSLHKGPTPKDITQQLYTIDELPPRWVLEPHMCRRGSHNLTAAIDDYVQFKNSTSVKFGSDCFHENLYFMLLSAEPADVQKLQDELSTWKDDTKLILSIFPHVPINDTYGLYNSGVEQNIFYLDHNSTEVQFGVYMGKNMSYPDYQATNIDNWLKKLMSTILQNTGITGGLEIDGYAFNHNWASNDGFIMSNKTKGLSYFGQDFADAMSKTLEWNATTPEDNISHMYTHNIYAEQQLNAFRPYIDNKSTLFSSVYPKDSNVIAQVENMNGTWANLKRTLQITLIHSIFAHPLISVPICGSTSFLNLAEQSDLCIRWYIMSATMPFFKISSELPLRDPENLPNGQARNAALAAVGRRRLLSHYFYTVLSRKEPITRPMYYDFYQNTTTFDLDEQYMVGDGLLVAQIFLKNQPTVSVYLPHEADVFYEFFGGSRYDEMGWHTLSAVATDWFVFIRGGRIIPLYHETHYSLAIALPKKDTEQATGSLFLKNTSLNFMATYKTLTIQNLLTAREDVCCDDPIACDPSELPEIFQDFSLYGLEDSVKIIQSTIDLCDDKYKDIDEVICKFDDGICNASNA